MDIGLASMAYSLTLKFHMEKTLYAWSYSKENKKEAAIDDFQVYK